MTSRLRAEAPALGVLGLILLVGLVLRVLHNDHGLPYVFYVDEGSHFTKRAVEVFRDANPGYFQNPSAYTYLLHLVYRVLAIPLGGSDEVIADYRANAEWIWEVSRGVAALLCLAGVAAVYAAGRALWDRRTGLVAAAVLCFAFLPVAFSRMALTDVGTLLPVALAVLGAVRIHETGGRPAWCAGAGAAAGLAIGFKYTAGLVLLAPLLALALPLLAGRDRTRLRGALLGALAVLAAGFAAFAVTNPFFLLDLDTALHQLRGQAELAGNETKFGQEQDVGPLYYLQSLTWGLGWAASAAAAAGAVLLWRADRARAALLLVFPVALFLYLSVQSRFFGRWLLPVYPVLALLAGFALVRAVEAVRARAPRLAPPALALGCAILLFQPLAAGFRSLEVLGHNDTRAIARSWLVREHPRGLRAVIEPAVPVRYVYRLRADGRTSRAGGPELVNDLVRDVGEEHVQYGTTLAPRAIDRYRALGYCTVVTFDLIRGRAEEAGDGDALAYYERLDRESDVVLTVSPYRADAEPPPFSFDLSYSYYSPAYVRPGPLVRVHRLHACRQGFGPRDAA